MSDQTLRKEISQSIIDAKNHGNGAGLALTEIIVISIALGFFYSSWWLFGGALFGLVILMCFKASKIILLVVFTVVWVFIAWVIGQWFESLGASVVLSIIALLISGGLHVQAFEDWKAK